MDYTSMVWPSSLSRRKISKDSICPICKDEEESLEHLFFLCPWTTPTWFGLQVCLVPTVFNTSTLCVWIYSFIERIANSEPDCLDIFSKALTALWTISKARNSKIFEDKNPNPNEVLYSINSHHTEFLANNPSSNPNMSLKPPVGGHLVDGAHLVAM